MRTPTPTTVDQIIAEKTKLTERLPRLDADREKIATQLADLETAERVLTRVSKAPPGRRPRILEDTSQIEGETVLNTVYILEKATDLRLVKDRKSGRRSVTVI